MPSFSERLDESLVRYLAYFNYQSYVRRMNLQGNEKVLEVGCGSGNLSRFLAERLPLGELTCLDNSKYWINQAKFRLASFPNIDFIEMDILDLERENCFDVLVVHYVLHDIKKETRKRAANIFRENLKTKGFLYIREPIRDNHGIPSEEIRRLIVSSGFSEKTSKEETSFPLKGIFYEGIFQKEN